MSFTEKDTQLKLSAVYPLYLGWYIPVVHIYMHLKLCCQHNSCRKVKIRPCPSLLLCLSIGLDIIQSYLNKVKQVLGHFIQDNLSPLLINKLKLQSK
jgi:hypothetical protein